MNISLLENGLHSLNKGYLTIKEYELCKDEKLAYFLLKDAILIFFNIQGFNYQVGSHLLKKVTNQNLETIKETILNYYKNN
ncbi:MAG: hypothetical protein ACRCYT_08200 [Cetobacterium sp.]